MSESFQVPMWPFEIGFAFQLEVRSPVSKTTSHRTIHLMLLLHASWIRVILDNAFGQYHHEGELRSYSVKPLKDEYI